MCIRDSVDAGGQRPGADHGQRLRQHLGVDQEDRALAGDPAGQRHRLGDRGGLVQPVSYTHLDVYKRQM